MTKKQAASIHRKTSKGAAGTIYFQGWSSDTPIQTIYSYHTMLLYVQGCIKIFVRVVFAYRIPLTILLSHTQNHSDISPGITNNHTSNKSTELITSSNTVYIHPFVYEHGYSIFAIANTLIVARCYPSP